MKERKAAIGDRVVLTHHSSGRNGQTGIVVQTETSYRTGYRYADKVLRYHIRMGKDNKILRMGAFSFSKLKER